jgi:hypothetical protein
MNNPLSATFGVPLEREFEAWITRELQDAFDLLGQGVEIWAVSPATEKVWPADAVLHFPGKVMGLQFKRPHLATSQSFPHLPDYSRLHWQLAQPPGQFPLVRARDEIFYCLPTFVNRRLYRSALHHSLFWRPGPPLDTNVWYANASARTAYNDVHTSPRWGLFVEQVLSCKVGRIIKDGEDLTAYLESLRATIREVANGEEETPGLRLLYLTMPVA